MEGYSSPVTHNVYTTGSGGGGGSDGASSSSGLHAMIPALMALGMGGQTGKTTEHHHHHPMPTAAPTSDTSTTHALAGLAAGAGLGRGTGYGAGMGGLGAAAGGVVGLIIGALLSGNGGWFGGGNNRNSEANLVTTTELQSALNAQTANQNTNSILQQLAALGVAIPESTGAVQLAIANSQNSLQNQNSQAQIALTNQAAQGQLQAAGNTALLTNNIADARLVINDNIHTLGTNTQAGFGAQQLQLAGAQTTLLQGLAGLSLQGAQQTALIQTSIRDDGDKTRALIIAQNDATLNRIITEQASAIIELRNERHVRGSGIEVTQTVNQLNAQNQAQAQQQQQYQLLSNLAAQVAGLTQVAHATNQNVIAGNAGAVSTGAQSANPVNVA